MKLKTFQIPKTGIADVLQNSTSLDSENTLVLVFGYPRVDENPQLVQELRKRFPKSIFTGCSTAGEIFQDRVEDDTIAVAVAQFEKTKLRQIAVPVNSSAESLVAGKTIAKGLNAPDLRAVFVLSDGLTVNGTPLLSGLNSVLDSKVVVTGGLAGDGDRMKKTWVINDGKVTSNFVTAVGFYGDNLEVGHGSQGGWDKFGTERTVTKSKGNVLYEIDGKPALELYKKYLGERASALPASALLFPLSMKAENQTNVVRTILGVDEKAQSMTFAGDIPEGSVVQLMKANFDRLIDGATGAANDLKSKLTTARSGDTLAIAVSCVGRRLVLAGRIEEEVEATLKVLPKDAKQIGFYSYGEISPYTDGTCVLHNQTMTLTTFSEK